MRCRVRSFVAIDPGVKACGVAVFTQRINEPWYLDRAWWAKGLAVDVAREVESDLAYRVRRRALWAVIEKPLVVHGRAFRGKTSSLLDLSIAVGELRALSKSFAEETYLISAADWTRGVPYEVREARLFAPAPLGLCDFERNLINWPAKSAAHNVVDAIAFGRWWIQHHTKEMK